MFYTPGAINMALALPANPPFNKEVLVGTAGKEGGGSLDPHGNKEDEDLQLEGQGGSGDNQTKTKVRALFLEPYATMHYTTASVVAHGVLQAWQCPPQEVAQDQHPLAPGDITSSLLFGLAVAVILSKYLITISHSLLSIYFCSCHHIQGGQGKSGLWAAFSPWQQGG
jgi:hypothetical protein